MKTSYYEDDELRSKVRCLAALAYVPPENVMNVLEIIAESIPVHDNMNELLLYFETTYSRGRRLPGRRDTHGIVLFQIETWNQGAAAVEGIHELMQWKFSSTA